MFFNEWIKEYYSHLYNMFTIVNRFNSKISLEDNNSFDKFCVFIYKNDLKYRYIN